ncbi:MAG: hypothetical protein JXR60_05555 [Bacteroidales bacterium]|nr:hypothetical protein [Bacteroidales bacterium]
MLKFKLFALMLLGITLSLSAQKVSPYFNCGKVDGTISQVKATVEDALKASGYSVTGGYNLSGKSDYYILTYTSKDIQRVCLKVKEKGVLASNLRIGLHQVGAKVEIIALNPQYIFLGYLRKSYDTYKTELNSIENDIKSIMSKIGNQYVAFGGAVEISELKHYHYMAMMPYFEDMDELESFDSFNEAIATIDKNLAAKKGGTVKVYKQSYTSLEIAVYGVGLLNKTTGEPHFMPIIGEQNFVAMPYEIVVIGKETYMLAGKFRFAMYWPELTMGTFTKIMSTPGDVEEILEGLTKK